MIVIVCIDDNKGIMFNHRRQSQDSILRNHILHMVSLSQTILWMNAYTKKQFKEDDNVQIIVDDDFLFKAGTNDYCFVENMDIVPYINRINKIILFKWNRIYPADIFFQLDLSKWILEDTEDFVGNSHDKITKEIYIR